MPNGTIAQATFLVQRGNTQFKCKGDQLKKELKDGDIMAFHRVDNGDNTTYKWSINTKLGAKLTLTYPADVNPVPQTFWVAGATGDVYVDWGNNGASGSFINTREVTPPAGQKYTAGNSYTLYWKNVGGDSDKKVALTNSDSLFESFKYMTAYGPPDPEYKLPDELPYFNCGAHIHTGSYLGEFNFTNVTDLRFGWKDNYNLNNFPSINLTSIQNITSAWENCTSLSNFPPDVFNNSRQITNADNAWLGCPLTKQSIENILVSLDRSGARDFNTTLGGAWQKTWTDAANEALVNLALKNVAVSHN